MKKQGVTPRPLSSNSDINNTSSIESSRSTRSRRHTMASTKKPSGSVFGREIDAQNSTNSMVCKYCSFLI